MSALSKLNFVELPANANSRDIMGYKRRRAVARLEDQRKLLVDPSFTRTVKRLSGKKGDANRVKETKSVRVTPCWRSLPQGGFGITLRLGGKMVEFAPGKTAVHAKAIEQVDAVLVAFEQALAAGEFDTYLQPKVKSEKEKLRAAADAAIAKPLPTFKGAKGAASGKGRRVA
jgi:1-acyl-sn-glycerol-3-phosphate acyltransferase